MDFDYKELENITKMLLGVSSEQEAFLLGFALCAVGLVLFEWRLRGLSFNFLILDF